VIGPGDVQWMTAGSGIIHQEMPKGDPEGRMGGFQLWSNLPAKEKMTDPRYREVRSDMIPKITIGGIVKIRIIAGNVNGYEGPVKDVATSPEYLDITMPKGSSFDHDTYRGHTVFAYVFEGSVSFGREGAYTSGHVVLFEDGDSLEASTDEGARFILVSGKPLGEPVSWSGPIVMNTDEEIRTAFAELRKGTFVKVGRTED
jgi:quercetin 2,3-dioxygenase